MVIFPLSTIAWENLWLETVCVQILARLDRYCAAAKLLRLACLIAAVIAPNVCTAQDAEPLKWKMYRVQDGKRAVMEFEAEFVRLTETGVVLRQPRSGKQTEVPLASLDLQSHFQAKKLGNPDAFNKPLVKAPEKVELPDVEYVAPTEEDLKSPFTESTTLEEFLEITTRAINEGDGGPVWHAIPPKMQGDLEGLVEKLVEKLGPTTLTQIASLTESLNIIVNGKKDFLFNNPQIVSSVPPDALKKVEAKWSAVGGVVAAVGLKENWDPENFQKGRVGLWLVGMSNSTKGYWPALNDLALELTPGAGNAPNSDKTKMTYKIISQSKGRAQVAFDVPGLPNQTSNLQKVGNIWVIPSMMNAARDRIDEISKAIDSIGTMQKVQLTGVLGQANAIVGELAKAESQSEFDASIDKLMSMIPKPPNP